jgi:hypothetical protein
MNSAGSGDAARPESRDRRLQSEEVPHWPKLAWAACVGAEAEPVSVFHGPCVEVNPHWCAEAAWVGDFTEGDFDLTDVVVGTGVRLRGAEVVFVSSSDTLNRLFWFTHEGRWIVTNSLPALLALTGVDLVDDYPYADALASIVKGLHSYQREIPSSGGMIHVVYFHNLKLANGEIAEIAKPRRAPDFADFATYRDFLYDAARHIGANARSAARRHRVTPIASVSSGYDSPAAAIVAREAGARDCVTIAKSRRDAANLFNTDDSGAAIATQLGMPCRAYLRKTVEGFAVEDAAWAAMGNVGDINLSLFDHPEPVSLLFTGFMGDVLWDRHTVQPDFLHRKDTSGARFSEARLELGVLLCSPVFWGCQQEARILALAHLPEMRGWTLNTAYDRPVPRRLLEEAGVSRTSFGVRKRAASYNRRYGQPMTAALREDFAEFVAARGKRPGTRLDELVAYALDALDYYLLRKLPQPIRFSCKDWASLPTPNLFFLWANARRKQRYAHGLQTLQPHAPRG